MIRLPPRSTRTDTLFPYTTLFRSDVKAGDFPLPGLAPRLNALLEQLESGRGVALLRGLPVADYDDEDLRLMWAGRSEEHTSELQSLMRISYAVFCLKKKKMTA